MTIGAVLDELKLAKADARVMFAFGGCVPTTVCSWRGSYDQPALQWDDESVGPTAAELVAELERAIDGREFHGWKGGEYSYTKKSILHIDKRGRWTSTEIARIESDTYSVVIHTERDENP